MDGNPERSSSFRSRVIKGSNETAGGPTDFFLEIGCAPLIGILLTSQIVVIRGGGIGED